MIKTLTITLVLITTQAVFGQEKTTKDVLERNTIYAEAFGQGFCYSINYDRLIETEKRFMHSATVGVVFVPQSMQFGDGTYVGMPFSYNWLLGKKSHHVEFGIGLTALFVNPNSHTVSDFYTYLTPKLGYRFQRPNGGVFFRVTATPMIDLLNVSTAKMGKEKSRNFNSFNNVVGLGYALFPWPGLSIGYTFQ